MNPNEFQYKITSRLTEKTQTPEKRNGKPFHPRFFRQKHLQLRKKHYLCPDF